MEDLQKARFNRFCSVCHRISLAFSCCGHRTRRVNVEWTMRDKLKVVCLECGGDATLLPDGTAHCEHCFPTGKKLKEVSSKEPSVRKAKLELIECHVGKKTMDDSCELCIRGKMATCKTAPNEKLKESSKPRNIYPCGER